MNDLGEVLAAIAEVQQPRSRYQLERFVLGQHDTEEMQYVQVCLELQQVYFALRRAELDRRKAEAEIVALEASGDPVRVVEADIKRLELEQLALAVHGARREFDVLVALWEQFPHRYTRAEIEELQPRYWAARLTRQAELEMRSSGTVGVGHLGALAQAGLLALEEG